MQIVAAKPHASTCRDRSSVKATHGRRRAALRGMGWAAFALAFVACDPHGCSCSCGCCDRAPTTTTAPASCAPTCASLVSPDAGDAGHAADAAALDARPHDASHDVSVAPDACPTPLPAESCSSTSCALGSCGTITSVRLWDPDAGVVAASLPEPVCRVPEGTSGCPCGAASGSFAFGPARAPLGTATECLHPCAFDPATRGDCPASHTCELDLCQPACSSDDVCQRRARDVDGDGLLEWVVDPSTAARCDAITGRCVRPGRAGAQIGDACADDHDCASDAFCLPIDLAGHGECVRAYCIDATCADPGLVCVRTPGQPSLCVPCSLLARFGLSDPHCAIDAGVDGG